MTLSRALGLLAMTLMLSFTAACGGAGDGDRRPAVVAHRLQHPGAEHPVRVLEALFGQRGDHVVAAVVGRTGSDPRLLSI